MLFVLFIYFREVYMKTNVTFRHLNGHHPNLHEAAMDASSRFQKFHDGIISTSVDFINEAEKIVQFTVHIQGHTLVIKESSDEFGKSLAVAEDRMVRQLKKAKDKAMSH